MLALVWTAALYVEGACASGFVGLVRVRQDVISSVGIARCSESTRRVGGSGMVSVARGQLFCEWS